MDSKTVRRRSILAGFFVFIAMSGIGFSILCGYLYFFHKVSTIGFGMRNLYMGLTVLSVILGSVGIVGSKRYWAWWNLSYKEYRKLESLGCDPLIVKSRANTAVLGFASVICGGLYGGGLSLGFLLVGGTDLGILEWFLYASPLAPVILGSFLYIRNRKSFEKVWAIKEEARRRLESIWAGITPTFERTGDVARFVDIRVDLNRLVDQLKQGGLVIPYRCPYCGATLKIHGKSSVEELHTCSYCGSTLEAITFISLLRESLGLV